MNSMKTKTVKDSPADGLSVGEPQVSLNELVSSIRDELAQVGESFGKAIQHALSAGRLLIMAKSAVGHGGWADWLHEHCELSERTAQRYMQLTKRATPLLEGNPPHAADLSVRRAITLLAKRKSQEIDTDISPDFARSEREPINKIKALGKKLERNLPPNCIGLILIPTPSDSATAAFVEQLLALSARSGVTTSVSEGTRIIMISKGCGAAPLEFPANVATTEDSAETIILD
jgi:hypothetical protein